MQAAGRIDLARHAAEADFLIISSHKIGGPRGAGALVVKGETLMPAPLIRGGGQERGHRSGTENLMSIVGFGAAAWAAAEGMDRRNLDIALLRDRLESGMRQRASDVIIHGAEVGRVANTSFFTLPGLKSETGQIAFDLEGIALSAGGRLFVRTGRGEPCSVGDGTGPETRGAPAVDRPFDHRSRHRPGASGLRADCREAEGGECGLTCRENCGNANFNWTKGVKTLFCRTR